MDKKILRQANYTIPVYCLNTVVVGSGAAGYNAADRLHQYGQSDIALVTEGVLRGTSRNTGSDKQTYYKLSLSGMDSDSVHEMAENLFAGQCVDGDHALCEAALSSQSFLRLVELGVPFPRNRYGEYIGYKTDHDPRRRATSVGPYTSKRMTECLEEAVAKKNILVFDHMQVIKILVDNGIVVGLLCLNLDTENKESLFVAFHCKNVIYACGGPAGMYADSVYPHGHYGATGIAFEAGIQGKNLTEWQYGLASTHPRWNVSGTYMQVLPQFISTDCNGNNRREFLYDFFENEGELLDKVFLKGYQWPFDVRKVRDSSSVIDILVHLEQCKGRRVFLDFRQNPANHAVDFSCLSDEALKYLTQAGACFGTPLERLVHMNHPAVEFYRNHGVDLALQPLEIALCAQHNNGGLDVDCWWQTNVQGFFAVGEVAATHGVYRPGGSALNAGQVGSTRAAQYIAAKRNGNPQTTFNQAVLAQIQQSLDLTEATLLPNVTQTVETVWNKATQRMSRFGGPIRDIAGIQTAITKIKQERNQFQEIVHVANVHSLSKVFRLWDILLCQQMYLQAMRDYITQGGKSRGSALYTDDNGEKPYTLLPDTFRFVMDDDSRSHLVQQAVYNNNDCHFNWRTVRPIPKDDDFFETVWREFRENENIF